MRFVCIMESKFAYNGPGVETGIWHVEKGENEAYIISEEKAKKEITEHLKGKPDGNYIVYYNPETSHAKWEAILKKGKIVSVKKLANL